MMNKIKKILDKIRHITFLDSRIIENFRRNEDELNSNIQSYKNSIAYQGKVIKRLRKESDTICIERDKLKEGNIQLNKDIKELVEKINKKKIKFDNSLELASRLKQDVIIELYEIIKNNVTDQSVIDAVNKKHCRRVYNFVKGKKALEYQPNNINRYIIL